MSTAFLEAAAHRRSIYAITKDSPIPDSKIQEILTSALTHAPSPFNVRSARAILVLGTAHTSLWKEAYRLTETNTPQAIGILGPKIEAFQRGHGTILFFDDSTAYEKLSPRFQALSKQYTEWEEHSSGMHQILVWTALDAEGLGCSLQHYQPSITPYVNETFGVPEFWTLKAQLVFGGLDPNVARPEAKEKTYLEEAVKVFGA